MYILWLCSSWGTSRICPAWSPSRASSGSSFVPIWGARVRSHAVRRRMFIVLMTAAHISPNVFSLRNFLSNILRLFLTVPATSFISIIHHIYTYIYVFYFYMSYSHIHFFGSSWQAGCPRLLVSDTIIAPTRVVLPLTCSTTPIR
jgi:hypothetical protein